VTSDLNPSHPNYAAAFEPLLGPRQLAEGVYRHDGVWIHRLPTLAEFRTRIVMPRLGAELATIRPDAVLAHGSMSPTTMMAAQYCSGAGIPFFADNHMEFSVQDRSPIGRVVYGMMRKIMSSYLAPRTSRFFGVADDCCQFLTDALGAPAEKVSLLPLGVDTDVFDFRDEARRRVRELHGIPSDALVIMQTGKLGPDKDPTTLARAAQIFMAEDSETWLVFVGSGSDADVQSIRDALGPQESNGRVLFLPMVQFTQLPDYYSVADVVVYPGGTSLSSLEAAACGRVVLMNDLPNSRWREELGVGRTFPLGDHKALAQQVAELAASRSLRFNLGQRASEVVKANFSYDHVATLLEQAIDDARAA
jgi:glycosyltransferase involved in cell wall biosynthesis